MKGNKISVNPSDDKDKEDSPFTSFITNIKNFFTANESVSSSPDSRTTEQSSPSIKITSVPHSVPYSNKEWQELFDSNSPDTVNQSRLLASLKKGIDPSLRGKIWMFLSKSFDSYKKSKNSQNSYQSLIERTNPEAEELISRDIHRTFLNHKRKEMFPVDSDKLYRVLKGYSIIDPEIGYCQGTNTIVGTILQCIGKEEFCFWTFHNMMKENNWRDFFIQKTPKLFRMVNVIKDIIKTRLKDLYDYFISIKFDDYLDIIFSHLFLTLFTYNCPLELSFRIIDLFWVYEEKVIFDTTINILYLKKEKIKTLEYEELLVYLKSDLVFDAVEEYGVDYIINMV